MASRCRGGSGSIRARPRPTAASRAARRRTMAIALRLSYDDLEDACKGKYGLCKSFKMRTALATYKTFEETKAKDKPTPQEKAEPIRKAENALFAAWVIWSATKE